MTDNNNQTRAPINWTASIMFIAGDRPLRPVQHSGAAVGAQPGEGAEAAGDDAHGVERRLPDRREARVRPRRRRVALKAHIGRGSAPERGVHAPLRIRVERLNGLRKPLRVDPAGGEGAGGQPLHPLSQARRGGAAGRGGVTMRRLRAALAPARDPGERGHDPPVKRRDRPAENSRQEEVSPCSAA